MARGESPWQPHPLAHTNFLRIEKAGFASFSRHCVVLINAKIDLVFPSAVPFLHTLFLENELQARKKITGQCCSTEIEFACENSANLEQETKATKIVTYPLFPLASSNIIKFWCEKFSRAYWRRLSWRSLTSFIPQQPCPVLNIISLFFLPNRYFPAYLSVLNK